MTVTIQPDGTVTVDHGQKYGDVLQAEVLRLHGIAHEVHRVAADALGIEVDGTMADAVEMLVHQYRKARRVADESHAERVSYADLHRGISDALGMVALTDAQLVEEVQAVLRRDARHDDELAGWSAKCNRMDMTIHEQARTIDALRVETQARAIDNARLETDLATERMAVEAMKDEVSRLSLWKRDADIAAAASVAAPQGGYAAGRAGALAEAATFRRRVCDALGLGFGAGDDVVVERAEGLAERARVTP